MATLVNPIKPRLQRIEARCRADNFNKSLQFPIADPLWMLARQWQFGELQGEDAGSPISTSVRYFIENITEVELGSSDQTYPLQGGPPLEAIVEAENMPMDWRMLVRIGQQMERYLQTELGAGAKQIITVFRNRYPLEKHTQSGSDEFIDQESKQFINFMAGKVINGAKLINAIDDSASPPPLPFSLSLPVIADEQQITAGVQSALNNILRWYARLQYRPENDVSDAWRGESLDYQFRVNGEVIGDRQTQLVAPSYRNGDLDWYNLNRNPDKQISPSEETEGLENTSTGSQGSEIRTETFLPTNVSFPGQPHTRLYEFEDARVDYGGLNTMTTDLGKLFLMDYTFKYGDDWFIIPLTLPTNSLTRIQKLTVTNVFGESIDIKKAKSEGSGPLHRWELYGLSESEEPNGSVIKDALYIPATTHFKNESKPIEEIHFVRDEAANKVFARLKTLTNGVGEATPGHELHTQYRTQFRQAELLEARAQMLVLITRINEINQQLVAIASGSDPRSVTFESLTTEVASLTQQLEQLQQVIQDTSNTLAEAATTDSNNNGESIKKFSLISPPPNYWVPYVPKRIDNNNAAIKFQRAKFLEQNEQFNLHSHILGDGTNEGSLNELNEVCITRAGLKVQLTRHWARTHDGEFYVWHGRKVIAGVGEGRSGLEFDLITKI